MTDIDNPSDPTISPGELQEIVSVFADSDLRELRLTVGNVEMLISRNEHVDVTPANEGTRAPTIAPTAAQPTTATPEAALPEVPAQTQTDVGREGLVEVRSPAVGSFYRRPAPDQDPFVEIGSDVAAGDPLGSIEVMKMFTNVTAEVAGTVVDICVDDAVLVEHGQVLFLIDPTTP